MSSFDSQSSIKSATLSDWPDAHHPLRVAIFHLLLNQEIAGHRCTDHQLVTPLNLLGGADGREDIIVVSNKLIREAFAGKKE